MDDLVDNVKQSLEDLISGTQSETESVASLSESFANTAFSSQTPTKIVITNAPYTTTLTGKNLDNYPLATIAGIAVSAKDTNANQGALTYAETLVFSASNPLAPASYLTDGFTITQLKITESIKSGTSTYANTNAFSGEIAIGASGALDHLMIKNVALLTSEKSGTSSYAQTMNLVSDSGVSADASTGSGLFKTFKFTTTTKDTGILNTHSFNGANLDMGDALSKLLGNGITNDELKALLLSGNDKITGTKSDDTLSGGAGYDLLTGGKGSDLFAFSAGDSAIDSALKKFDTIKDFKYSDALGEHDTLQFDLITKNFVSRESSAVKTLALAQTDANAQMANSFNVVFELVGKNGYVFVDYNGDHVADSVVKLSGVKTLNTLSVTIPPDTSAPVITSDQPLPLSMRTPVRDKPSIPHPLVIFILSFILSNRQAIMLT
jgi:Ca2+-binding RTX toxin-like protein